MYRNTTANKSAKVDLSREFEGRALTMLGEILQEQNNLRRFLEKSFHVPDEYLAEDQDGSDEFDPVEEQDDL